MWNEHRSFFYVVCTMHCDTTVTIKTNYMHSCNDLILQKFYYMFWASRVHRQEVICRIQALWYNVLFKYMLYCGESSLCLYIGWSIYTIMIHHNTIYGVFHDFRA